MGTDSQHLRGTNRKNSRSSSATEYKASLGYIEPCKKQEDLHEAVGSSHPLAVIGASLSLVLVSYGIT